MVKNFVCDVLQKQEDLMSIFFVGMSYIFSPLISEERNDWISVLLSALKSPSLTSQLQAAVSPEKCGYLELRGYKAKIFTVLRGNSVWLCKNEQVSLVILTVNYYSLMTATVLSF